MHGLGERAAAAGFDLKWLQHFGVNVGGGAPAQTQGTAAPSSYTSKQRPAEVQSNAAAHPAHLVGVPGSGFEPGATSGFTLKEHQQLPFTTNWDPRDYDWAPPSDEDEPWETGAPEVARSSLALDANGTLQASVKAAVAGQAKSATSGQAAVPKGRCPICLDDHGPGKDAVTLECGQHFYCTPCAVELIKTTVQSAKEPLCVSPGCRQQVPLALAARILDSRTLEKFLLARLTAAGDIRRCPACQVHVFIHMDQDAPSTRCPRCEARFCRSCGCSWSSQHVCKESKGRHQRRERRQASRRFQQVAKDLGFKKCPQCGIACEKADDGCDHLTCVACRFEFCWLCSADRRVILAHGCHYHFERCKYYAAYSGKDRIRLEKDCAKCKAEGCPCVPPSEVVA
mmetsp:Transcript_52303/g.124789  ORF Transcript_52303/g.124789 Transcript_52303/m.124789 type:complete len:398 (+) Transcript_52303:138-1331(+)